MTDTPTTEEIAQHYSAMVGSVSVITNVIDDDNDFCNDLDTAGKKERVARSMGYIVHMKDLDDWGSEDMTPITNAITAATNFIG